jgi:hypothetical protein
MKSVVIIGTSHKYQLSGSAAESDFKGLVEQVCDSKRTLGHPAQSAAPQGPQQGPRPIA